ncbi:ABC transporter ATP-binding protein [Nocardioides carbamazepini]|uniref:ABC transporter ATP-binding protein n=1 Tax=Nocardioides carbamazepini TaxID=2854259 RepID=UPI00214A667D|nr:ABC transporter ATP-binding protein [Nocardioides carbamazepini]MCR1784968.1 ABC transporter ATP-binding protein [Nocardioides carbamazepini]
MNDLRQPRLVMEAGSKTYYSRNASKEVLAGIDLTVHASEFLSIVGPSGAGKTTLLRCLSGLMPLSSGRIILDGEVLTEPSPVVSVVFQEYSRSLMPWMTVADNVALPLRGRKVPRASVKARVGEVLESVGLSGTERQHPWQLSGGMQQRVAIARALVTQPEVLFMDEPFASVDAQTRLDLEDLTRRLQQERQMSVVLITHDIDEAIYLSDRVVVLSKEPATVREIIENDLGAVRDQISTRELPAFMERRSHVLGLIREIQHAKAVPAELSTSSS